MAEETLPINEKSLRLIVYFASSLRNRSGAKKPFHAFKKDTIKDTTIIGMERGNKTALKYLKEPAPSKNAFSSRLSGNSFKNEYVIKIEKVIEWKE